MAPIAIACGNTFIMKPSEKDPSVVLRLAELWAEAGLPPGVFNVMNGDKEAVDALLDDDRIRAVSFVGSTPIAKPSTPEPVPMRNASKPWGSKKSSGRHARRRSESGR